MSLERDPKTGWLTTGHEWNGLTELNTPLPRLVSLFLALAVLFSVGCWVLMPAWPVGTTYTKGLLGLDDRTELTESVKQATTDRTTWTDQIATRSFAEIEAEPRVMTAVRQTGPVLFGDNCAACHGRDAKGGKGFPDLRTTSWLWGGSPEAIAETIRVGINSAHPESRNSQMPAFGRDQILQRTDIENVVAYVLSLSDPKEKPVVGNAEAGKAVFTANCVVCHGSEAKGTADVGAPNLTDSFWMYGGDGTSIYNTVWGGRQGHMPTWESRLSPVDRKILALYLVDLGKLRP
ncbi:cytochrome-c oxidase, cbb3-type subunit III [Reyranella soli]|uniref:Cbb3-type cytochrome c oxidase subunit n=1 Tax=Reyranella soli TaxID=1230389 RepID=A0A512N8H7_9HYPH|nr:cytochrome-c oxidase, cbb3-type subunit III [Reyranella soli]GEP55300.1 Cbb3-type cytochrome c oxidase subunit [Reyranella soli]